MCKDKSYVEEVCHILMFLRPLPCLGNSCGSVVRGLAPVTFGNPVKGSGLHFIFHHFYIQFLKDWT